MSVAAAAAYSRTASAFHWMVGLPMIGSVGAVLQAQRVPKSEKQYWMHKHESLGLLTAAILAPRLAYRLFARSAYQVAELPGTRKVEKLAANTTYAGLHGFAIVCSVTGVGMNYLGGWGLPFFWTKIEGLPKTPENKEKYGPIARQMYDVHKQVGMYGKYLIPLHVGGSFVHVAKGHSIFARINPFSVPRP